MNDRNNSTSGARLIAIGLLLAALPFLTKEYIPLPDFFRGFLAGLGLGFEFMGLLFIGVAKKKCVGNKGGQSAEI